MKIKMNSRPGAVLALLVLTLTANAATQVYDLKNDWSDTQNPNGTWSYRWGDGQIPSDTSQLLSNDPLPWSFSSEVIESIERAGTSDVVPGSLELGDIFVVGVYYGVVARWTAPANGMVNVSGTTWFVEGEGGGGQYWTLQHNGNVLSTGSPLGMPTRDLPFNLSSSSGGEAALQNIAVQAGDRIELIFQWGGPWRSGVNFTITLTTDSVDPVSAIEDLALAVVAMNLQNGIENSLDSKLDAALDALVDANFNNDGAACKSLAAFINAVQAQRGKKITNALADQLIASAQQILAMLNCGN